MNINLAISNTLLKYTNSESFDSVISFNVITLGFIISVGFLLIFQREISKKTIFFSVFFGFFYSEINDFIYSLYKNINGFGNNQISTVLLLFFILTILSFMCFFKKTRTIDRIFTTISILSITILFFIIHVAVVNVGVIQTLKYNNKQNEINISMFVAKDNINGFYEYCDLHDLICDSSLFRNTNKEEIKIFDEYDNLGGTGFSALKGRPINQYLKDRKDILSRSYLNVGIGNYEHSFIVVLNKKENYTLLAYDIKDVQYIHGKYVVIFYTWYGLALLVWVYGLLGLLMFHKMKFRKRNKR